MAGEDNEGASDCSAQAIADEALRAIDEVRQLLEGAGPDDLKERAAQVRERLNAAMHGLEGVLGKEEGSLGASIANTQETVAREIEAAEEHIRENPIGSVVVAAGVGFLVGLLIRRES